jgi:hypothetical protein
VTKGTNAWRRQTATGDSLLTHDRDADPFETIHADFVLVQRALPWDTGHHILIPRAASAPDKHTNGDRHSPCGLAACQVFGFAMNSVMGDRNTIAFAPAAGDVELLEPCFIFARDGPAINERWCCTTQNSVVMGTRHYPMKMAPPASAAGFVLAHPCYAPQGEFG